MATTYFKSSIPVARGHSTPTCVVLATLDVLIPHSAFNKYRVSMKCLTWRAGALVTALTIVRSDKTQNCGSPSPSSMAIPWTINRCTVEHLFSPGHEIP